MTSQSRLSVGVSALALLAACHGSDAPPTPTDCGSITAAFRFPNGSVDGHADPAGAKAAGQARAGRITDMAMVHSPADVRFPVHVNDFLLVNDKIGVYIEAARPSDGFNPFGGEIAGISPIGDDGLPLPISEYGEGFYSAGGMVVAPEVVSVIADGSDGGPAIVRAQGQLKIAPFLEAYSALFGDVHPMPAALDYVLAPGAEKVTLRLSIQNFDATPVDLSTAQIVAFLMNRPVTFTPEKGFATLDGFGSWLGWEATNGFAMAARPVKPLPLNFLAIAEGAQLFMSSGATMDACKPVTFDYIEIFAASPGIDAVRQAILRADNLPAWRAITGTVTDGAGAPIAGAYVHATQMDGTYLTRATTGSDGKYTLHAPPMSVQLQVTARGLPTPTPITVDGSASTQDLSVPQLGTISVTTIETGSGVALPARIQVFPAAPLPALPASFGIDDAGDGRVHLEFSVDGKATLAVSPGTYNVVVSHGYEYEMFQQMVTVASGQTVTLAPSLQHSVDTTGALSADFHIHAFYSQDAPDPVDYKVRGALAEGLEIPVSSEHEYVADFEPVIEALGATQWARGLASEELSTSTYGHFGIVPIDPQQDQVNRGAVLWADTHPPDFFNRVRQVPSNPALIVNHPQSTTGFKGYFADVGFDATSASGDPTDWSDNFDAIEVCNDSDWESNRADVGKNWFSLLNHGKVVYAVGNSDNHKMTRDGPVGYPRNFLRLGTDVPQMATPDQIRDAIKAGHNVVSGGLYMTVAGPGGVGPGDTIHSTAGQMQTFDVIVQCPSWLSAKQLEVIVDGQTTQTIPLAESMTAGPARQYEAMVDVMADGNPHFVVFHASSDVDLAPVHPGKKPFALSNPIFY